MSRPRRTIRRHPKWRRDSDPRSIPALAWSRIRRPSGPLASEAHQILWEAQRARQCGQRVVSVQVLPYPRLLIIQEYAHA